VVCSTPDAVVSTFYVDGFASAAEAILEWLRGNSASTVAEQVAYYVISAPGVHAPEKGE
jgi:hypothetical protein